MPQFYEFLTDDEKKERFQGSIDALTADLVEACENFRRQLATINYNATEINQQIRTELEDVKEAYR